MAELRVQNFDDKLMARLKSEAALSGHTIRDFVHIIIAAALKGWKRA